MTTAIAVTDESLNEAWELFDSRRFLHRHRETMRDSFKIALSAALTPHGEEAAATPAPQNHMVGAARSFMELFVAESGDDRSLTVEDIDHMELTHRYAALEAALAGAPVTSPRLSELEERVENALQAASETHSSWEARCHAILNALGFDFGFGRPNAAEAVGNDLTDCFRHHITTTIGWIAFGARPGPEMQMYEEGFKAGYRRCQSDNEPELGEEDDEVALMRKTLEWIEDYALAFADLEEVAKRAGMALRASPSPQAKMRGSK